MLDQSQTDAAARIETYDLIVVGAGIAGLNALSAAVEYLPKGARVLLLDQKDAAGGMWNTAYDYVRLHQPHPMFTVGNMKWNWGKPREYLAARNEVQGHLSSALTEIAKKVALTTGFGQTVTRCAEVSTERGHMAEVTYHPIAEPETMTTVRADRAIHASGLNYAVADPIPLSSKRVVSVIPQKLRKTLADHPGADVVVVGGGKTGMDTILATLAEDANRKITLIKGRGTNFLNRTEYLPTGTKRWTSGEPVSRVFRDVALNFDGDNEDHTIAHIRRTYTTDPATDNGVFLYGLQSEHEHEAIQAGLTDTLADYLTDVTDTPEGPRMEMRSGATVMVRDGTIIVNCTGSFFRVPRLQDHMPILSPNDCVMSINAREAFHFLTSVVGFFSVHLQYRGKLRGHGFYTVDLEDLFRKDRTAWVGASAAQAYMNQVLSVQALPMMLLDRCGLDMDRWYPFPRRMAALMRMKSSAVQDIAHCRRALDRVAERFDVRAAELV